MNKEFIALLMEKTQFPEEAKAELSRCAQVITDAGREQDFDKAVASYREKNFDIKSTEPQIKELSQATGIHEYSIHCLLLMEAAVPTFGQYQEKGIPEKIFWDTFSDLRYKVLECHNVYHVWGNFVSFWYPIFYKLDIFKLGRLEFERCPYDLEQPYEKNGISLHNGDIVYGIHIPSSGEPFDLDARLDSYEKAFQFFREELGGKPFVCVCFSWLLHSATREILPPTSNIIDFGRDFDLVFSEDTEDFHDNWRVFGAEFEKPLSELPEKTSMQRAFKQHLLSGGKTGEGYGVLIYDGEKLITRQL